MIDVKGMTVKPLSDALGAEITGINAATIDDETFSALLDIFHDNVVVVVRDQALTPAEQTVFTERFGKPKYLNNSDGLMAQQPEIQILSTEKVDGKYIGNPDAGTEWHSDNSYADCPTAYTFLQSVHVPKVGGDTEWNNMVKVYDSLDDDLKSRIQGLIGIHSYSRSRNPRVVRKNRVLHGENFYDDREPTDVYHPIVRTHPHTGRKALYLSQRFTIGIKDMDDAVAQPLMDEIFEYVDRREFVYRHKWRIGDLVMWDNRSTIHIALGGVKEPEVRRMHRTSVIGETPF